MTISQRMLATYVLCLGSFMIVLDGTIVNIALPSIRVALGFSQTTLVWVVNAYLLTFGGFLLLGGRLGDIYGHRRIFLLGIAIFTLASGLCGFAISRTTLICARALQGFGGALVTSVALSLVATMFPEMRERAKAMGFFGFVEAGGGSIGALLGGVITARLGWHWIFLLNLPIGVGVYCAGIRLLPKPEVDVARSGLDIGGALSVTASLLLAVFAIVNGNDAGWTSVATLAEMAAAIGLFLVFLRIERDNAAPLVPLPFLFAKNIAVSNTIAVLWAASMFAWFFLAALYMQLVLQLNPMQVGLAFLPACIIMAACSLGFSAKLIDRYGLRRPLVSGLLAGAIGLALFGFSPVAGNIWRDVIPGMMLLGLGAGIAYNPMLMAAMDGSGEREAGIASGIVNTSFMMGGALGLAVLAALATARTNMMHAVGIGELAARNGGYHIAFFSAALLSTIAAAIGATILTPGRPPEGR